MKKFNLIKKNSETGITLVELLVVFVVLGILASITLTSLNPLTYQKRGRDAQRKADINQIRSALEMYRADNPEYPSALTELSPATGTKYIDALPTSPPPGSYTYTRTSTSTYTLYACLEDKNDPQGDPVASDLCAGDPVSYTKKNP